LRQASCGEVRLMQAMELCSPPPLFIEEGDRRPNKKGVRGRSSVG